MPCHVTVNTRQRVDTSSHSTAPPNSKTTVQNARAPSGHHSTSVHSRRLVQHKVTRRGVKEPVQRFISPAHSRRQLLQHQTTRRGRTTHFCRRKIGDSTNTCRNAMWPPGDTTMIHIHQETRRRNCNVPSPPQASTEQNTRYLTPHPCPKTGVVHTTATPNSRTAQRCTHVPVSRSPIASSNKMCTNTVYTHTRSYCSAHNFLPLYTKEREILLPARRSPTKNKTELKIRTLLR